MFRKDSPSPGTSHRWVCSGGHSSPDPPIDQECPPWQGRVTVRCKRSAAVSGTLLVQPREKGIECPAPAPLGEECPSPTTHPAALTVREEIGENAFLYAGGGVAQLGEHHVRNVGVEGSIPFSSTTFPLDAHSTRLGVSSILKGNPAWCRVPFFVRCQRVPSEPPGFLWLAQGGDRVRYSLAGMYVANPEEHLL